MLNDAQKLAHKNPDTFTAPSKDELDKIKPNDYVKVGQNNERFWCEVASVYGDEINALVANELVNGDLKIGDPIQLKRKHVYDIKSITAGVNELTHKWEDEIKKHLVGKTIDSVRYLTVEECEAHGWDNSASLVIFFEDGSHMYSSTDDEGNGPGALFTSFEGMEVIPVCRARDASI